MADQEEVALSTPVSEDRDAHFEALLAAPPLLPLPEHIPKVAHFVFVYVKEVTWMEYVAIRSAHLALQAEKINLWIPEGDVNLPGEMWKRIMTIPGTVIRQTAIPDTVYNKTVQVTQHVSDVLRLKILWEEGGIYMDTNLVALRSSDPVLYAPNTRSTVMGLQPIGGLCNALIMSKPHSPFLARWMSHYTDFEDREWDKTSVYLPYEMYKARDPDLTVLDDHAWFYPIWGQGDEPLKTMWVGKSWSDIDKNYGVHFWHWETAPSDVLTIDPWTTREIDTPLFCKMRYLFDDLDGDGYKSVPDGLDANCSAIHTTDLRPHAQGLISHYDFSSDSSNIKWVDSSGNRLHGWSPSGTALFQSTTDGSVARNMTAGSYAVLPVPLDWDTRSGSVRLTFKLEPPMPVVSQSNSSDQSQETEIGLLKIRIETSGEILLTLKSCPSTATGTSAPAESSSGITTFCPRIQWYGEHGANNTLSRIDDIDSSSSLGFVPDGEEFQTLTLSLDRISRGLLSMSLSSSPSSSFTSSASSDSEHIARWTTASVPLVASPKIAHEIWFNSRDFGHLDTDFRGVISGLSFYNQAVEPGKMIEGRKCSPLRFSSPFSASTSLPYSYRYVRSLTNSYFLAAASPSSEEHSSSPPSSPAGPGAHLSSPSPSSLLSPPPPPEAPETHHPSIPKLPANPSAKPSTNLLGIGPEALPRVYASPWGLVPFMLVFWGVLFMLWRRRRGLRGLCGY
ncbi:MAG: hypothetical protein M1819_005740 [Sarea resinae]|nr:MAG: hypothetical protein M1819_005740 [Sarea resinae]